MSAKTDHYNKSLVTARAPRATYAPLSGYETTQTRAKLLHFDSDHGYNVVEARAE